MVTSDAIETALKNEDKSQYCLRENVKGTNRELWSRFSIVHSAVDGARMDFAACNACKRVYVFKKDTGTKTLNNHSCGSMRAGKMGDLDGKFIGRNAEDDKVCGEIETYLRNDNYTKYKLRENVKGVNRELWSRFSIVYDATNGARLDYAACNSCKRVYVFKKDTGTKSLKNHLCNHLRAMKSKEFQGRLKSRSTNEDKKAMMQACIDYCAHDLRPLDDLASAGLKALIQRALDIGYASKAPLSVHQVLPDPTLVEKNLEELAMTGRENLSAVLSRLFESGIRVGSSLSLWHGENNKTSYLSASVNYIDEDYELHDRTLFVTPLPTSSHPILRVNELFIKNLATFKIFPKYFDKFTVVADTTSNLLGSDGLSTVFELLSCVGHQLAICLGEVVNVKSNFERNDRSHPIYSIIQTPTVKPLFDMIDGIKGLVEYVNATAVQPKWSNILQRQKLSDWKSLLYCLENLRDVFNDVMAFLAERNESHRAKDIDLTLLDELIAFLQPFRNAILDLERANEPTLHKVVYWRYVLQNHLQPVSSIVLDLNGDIEKRKDSSSIAAFKSNILGALDDKLRITQQHIAAALLDPILKFKLLKFGVTEMNINTAKNHLLRVMIALGKTSNGSNGEMVQARPSKRQRRPIESMYGSLDDEDVDENFGGNTLEEMGLTNPRQQNDHAMYEKELAKYFERKLSPQEMSSFCNSSHFSLLKWWKECGQAEFPMLARVVRSMLCIPATSTKSTISDENAALNPSMVDNILFFRSNSDLC